MYEAHPQMEHYDKSSARYDKSMNHIPPGSTGNMYFHLDVAAETQNTQIEENRIKTSKGTSPLINDFNRDPNNPNSQSYFTTINDFDSLALNAQS